MAEQKILDRIKKLLELAKSTNPNEASLAMSRAQELMAKHGVDFEAIELGQVKEHRVKSQFSVSRMKPYERILINSIADAFGCMVMWINSLSWLRDSYAEWVLVGPADRLQLASYACDVLMPQLKKARSEYADKTSKEIWKDPTLHVEWDRAFVRRIVTDKANSFAMGWASEIRSKVIKFALNDKEQKVLETYVKSQVEDRKAKSDKKDSYDPAAIHDGKQAARDAHLHRPIDGSSDPENLLTQTKKIGQG